MGLIRGVFKLGTLLVLLAIVFVAGWLVAKTGTGEAMDPATLPQIERQFVEKMNGAALVGNFTVAGGEDRAATADRYDIYSVEKVGEDRWRFNAKIGEIGITVPVAVTMRFVDDTPLIVLNDASIPGLGIAFSARVIFHGDLYAGTWGDGKRSGLMYGRIERGSAQK